MSGWMWSKGLAARCDRRIPDEFPPGRGYVPFPITDVRPSSARADLIDRPEQYDDLRDGDVVWVRGSWVRSFAAQVLPRLRAAIVLVTGDSDTPQPSGSMPAARQILDSPWIRRWYTQNLDGSTAHPKLAPIPIGLDLHTRAERRVGAEPIRSVADQEAELATVVASLPPLAERRFGVYVDFSYGASPSPPPPGARLRSSRADVVAALATHPLVVHQNERLPRTEMWRRKGEFAFSLSLPGNGLDCHRTWESLVLGQVVLTPGSSLDPLLTGTRAMTFTDPAEIERSALVRWWALACATPHPHPALTIGHWTERVRSAAR